MAKKAASLLIAAWWPSLLPPGGTTLHAAKSGTKIVRATVAATIALVERSRKAENEGNERPIRSETLKSRKCRDTKMRGDDMDVGLVDLLTEWIEDVNL